MAAFSQKAIFAMALLITIVGAVVVFVGMLSTVLDPGPGINGDYLAQQLFGLSLCLTGIAVLVYENAVLIHGEK